MKHPVGWSDVLIFFSNHLLHSDSLCVFLLSQTQFAPGMKGLFQSMEREYHSCGMEGGLGGLMEVKRNNKDEPFSNKKL